MAYKTLPRPQFSQLQEKIIPIYVGMQTVLPAVLALTYPGSRNPLGPPSGYQGTFTEVNKWSVLVPLGTMFLMGLANMLFIRPKATEIRKLRMLQGMYDRLRQISTSRLTGAFAETRDGKKSYDAGPHSTEMQKLNRAFGRMHGISSLVNLGALITTIWYGISLAERLQ